LIFLNNLVDYNKDLIQALAKEEKMKLSTAVKPISHIKSHASEIISEISETGNSVVVTVNGEARVIIQDIKEYEKDRESMAMLKILAMAVIIQGTPYLIACELSKLSPEFPWGIGVNCFIVTKRRFRSLSLTNSPVSQPTSPYPSQPHRCFLFSICRPLYSAG
jgi:prevent-host-death family protein